VKKRKIRVITAFKVIPDHRYRYTYRKPVGLCDFLLVINSNWHPISYHFRVFELIAQILDTLRVWDHFERLKDNVRCSSWAHWKTLSGLSIRVKWTLFARCYGWVATSEEIENRRFRSNAVSLIQNFR